MALINEFVSTYGVTILYAVLTFLAGKIGLAIKNVYTKHVNDQTKREVAQTCVKAVEQLYKDLNGSERLDKCIESVVAMLGEKGITATELEIRMLIESAVHELKSAATCDIFADDKQEKEDAEDEIK